MHAPPPPRHIAVDIMDACSLQCPLCPTGARDMPQPATRMELAAYVRLLEHMPTLRGISLFNWGEPLLHPEVARFVAETTRRRISVDMHTHLSLDRPERFFEELVASCHHRTRITASIDGASQDAYAAYRRGGELELAVANLERLVALRDARNAPLDLVWKMLVHRDNEHEVELARARAERIGARFVWHPMGLAEDLVDWRPAASLDERKRRWLPVDRGYWNEAMRQGRHDAYLEHFVDAKNLRCRWLWERMVVTPRGDVLPCCLVTSDAHRFGNVIADAPAEVWTNATYTRARALFSAEPEPSGTVCDGCPVVTEVRRLRQVTEEGER